MATASQHRIRKRALKVAHFAGLFLVMSIICLPGLWVVLNSFRPTVEHGKAAGLDSRKPEP